MHRNENSEDHPFSQNQYSVLREIHLHIWQEAMECPETVLETSCHRISLRQLRYCAYHAPDIAYALRHKLSPKRRAVILGYTLELAGLDFDDDEVNIYMDEITDSMISHPSIWNSNFGQNWEILCQYIQNISRIDLGQSEDLVSPFYPLRPTEPRRVFLRQLLRHL